MLAHVLLRLRRFFGRAPERPLVLASEAVDFARGDMVLLTTPDFVSDAELHELGEQLKALRGIGGKTVFVTVPAKYKPTVVRGAAAIG